MTPNQNYYAGKKWLVLLNTYKCLDYDLLWDSTFLSSFYTITKLLCQNKPYYDLLFT